MMKANHVVTPVPPPLVPGNPTEFDRAIILLGNRTKGELTPRFQRELIGLVGAYPTLVQAAAWKAWLLKVRRGPAARQLRGEEPGAMGMAGCRPEVAARIVQLLMEDSGVGELFGGGGRSAEEVRSLQEPTSRIKLGREPAPPLQPERRHEPVRSREQETRERRERARELYRPGMRMRELAALLGVSEPTASSYVDDLRPRRELPAKQELERRRARIVQLAKEGRTYQEIAQELHVSTSTVKQSLRAAGPIERLVLGRLRRPRVKVEQRLEKVLALRKAGQTIEGIAAALGVSQSTVYNDLARGQQQQEHRAS